MDSSESYYVSPDEIANLCYKHFNDTLAKKGKPQKNKEWTMVAAIVLRDQSPSDNRKSLHRVVSMGTGSKCIGQSKMSSNGDILHDSHAEIMARRGFIRYLYHHIQQVYSGIEDDLLIFDSLSRKCSVKEGLSFIFFSSHTPCGDASIVPKPADGDLVELQPTNELVNVHNNSDGEPQPKVPRRDESHSDIHRTGAKCVNGGPQDLMLPGEGHHMVGVLRTKPGRGDRTLSMSCSDKLAKWNLLGLQGSLLMNFLKSPVYFSHIIIGKCPFSVSAFKRALIDRFQQDLLDFTILPFRLNAVKIALSDLEFEFSKRLVEMLCSEAQPCPSSIVWCCCPTKELEVAVEGKKQGATKKTQNTPAGRLDICRKNLFQTFVSILQKTPSNRLPFHLQEYKPKLDELTYQEAKELASTYQKAWKHLLSAVMPTWTRKNFQLMQFKAKDEN